jgi:hypothetical protein
MNDRSIISFFAGRSFIVMVGIVVIGLMIPAAAVFAAWDGPTNRYNPDGTGQVVGYDTSDCTGPNYIVLYHGTTYKNLTNWHGGSDGSNYNDKISCIIVGPKTKFEYWQHKDYKGSKGTFNNTTDQIDTKVISGWWDNSMSSVKVWKQ